MACLPRYLSYVSRLFVVICVLSAGTMAYGQANMPIVTDSRIKTFVYNENDVFRILTHYGYQSNIEFGKSERIKTVSVGDRVSWQIVPAGRRLFIKALEEKAHTNMTVVTNKRAYQFDLRASDAQPLHPNEELVYVVRFFYPDEQPVTAQPPIYTDHAPPAPPVFEPALTFGSAPNAANYINYNYTFTGPSEMAPVRIYDDGKATYFLFPSDLRSVPFFFVVTPDGRETPVDAFINAQGLTVVGTIAPRFSIRHGSQTITVFNESHPMNRLM